MAANSTLDIDLDAQRERIAEAQASMTDPDPDYSPSPTEQVLLAIMADEGWTTTKVLQLRGGFDQQYVSEMCGRLADHGWLWKLRRPDVEDFGNLKPVDGHYAYNAEAVFDPESVGDE